jgi:hypothetical protein
LWSIIARKTIASNAVFELADEAPNAIPSAAAWITRPRVVDEALECVRAAEGLSSGEDEAERERRLSISM